MTFPRAILLALLLSASSAFAGVVDPTHLSTNGRVYSIAATPSTVYIAGDFTRIGMPSGTGVAVHATTGALQVAPRINGTVNVVVPDGAGGWYVGGLFSKVGAVLRQNLAHIQADGTPSAWDPSASNAVYAMVVTPTTIYVGGAFTIVAGQARTRIAALDRVTGNALAFTSPANSTIFSLALSGTTLYAGGFFTSIGGANRNRIAALDATTGTPLAWDPNADFSVRSIVVSGSSVYVGGEFNNIGGQPRSRIACLDAGTGLATPWNPAPDGVVYSMVLQGSTLYVGGGFVNIGGQSRLRLAAVDAGTGTALAWDGSTNGVVTSLSLDNGTIYAAGSFTTVRAVYANAQARRGLAALDANTAAPLAWNPDVSGTVATLAATGGSVFLGGEIIMLGGTPRGYLAAFDATTGALLPWNPNASGTVRTIMLDGNTLYAGGLFNLVAGQLRPKLAAIDATTGAVSGWTPNADNTVIALARSGTAVIAGGVFANIGGQPRPNLAALDPVTGNATGWMPAVNGVVLALATHGGTVYVGGSFNSAGGQSRNSLAEIDLTTGTATAWNALAPNGTIVRALATGKDVVFAGGDIFGTIGGKARNNLVALSMATGVATNWNPNPNSRVQALNMSASRLLVGGQFTSIGGSSRIWMAEVDTTTGQSTAIASSMTSTSSFPTGIETLALAGSRLYAGGEFNGVNSELLSDLAVFSDVLLEVGGQGPVGVSMLSLAATNPARSRLAVALDLPRAGRARLDLLDLQGRRVARLLDEWRPAGPLRSEFGGAVLNRVIPGVHFLRLSLEGEVATRRIVFLE